MLTFSVNSQHPYRLPEGGFSDSYLFYPTDCLIDRRSHWQCGAWSRHACGRACMHAGAQWCLCGQWVVVAISMVVRCHSNPMVTDEIVSAMARPIGHAEPPRGGCATGARDERTRMQKKRFQSIFDPGPGKSAWHRVAAAVQTAAAVTAAAAASTCSLVKQ